MDVVASRAKTTKRTLYAHFSNKQALFLAVFDFLKGFFLDRLRTPDDYSDKPDEALVLFCGRFLETLLSEGAIRMCRVCVAEAARFPDASAQYCYVVFTEIEMRLTAYLRLKFALSPRASADAAQRLLGQVLHPRFPRALFGADPLVETFDEEQLSPDFDLKPIRRAVKMLLDSLNQLPK
jgi:AcrR family transcriptional regulator